VQASHKVSRSHESGPDHLSAINGDHRLFLEDELEDVRFISLELVLCHEERQRSEVLDRSHDANLLTQFARGRVPNVLPLTHPSRGKTEPAAIGVPNHQDPVTEADNDVGADHARAHHRVHHQLRDERDA